MNTDQIKGEWEQFKGRVKMAYGELTDDDYMQAQGSRDKLFGIIQRRYGDTKDNIQKKLDSLEMPKPQKKNNNQQSS